MDTFVSRVVYFLGQGKDRAVIQTLHGAEKLSAIEAPLSLALGVFDGVHVGHQEVIQQAVKRAKEYAGKSGVVTFEPHPIQVLAPEKAPKRILASLGHKERLLERLGVDYLFVVEFSKDFSARSAESFLAQLTTGDLRSIAVGEDWKFGKGRGGDGSFLKEQGGEHGFTVDLIAPVMLEGERVSSTRIRQAIRDGNICAASDMLGRPYSVMGQVVKGRQLGRTIGFPTANIEVGGEQLPPSGVWEVQAYIGNEWKQGIANLGKRPTVEQGEVQRLLEVFVFDWDGDLYDTCLEVRFGRFVREEKKFNGVEELVAQIQKDVAKVRVMS